MSEDSARRAFKQAAPEVAREWLKKHLGHTYESLLEHAWVMDLDSTVKPLYGKQEKAVKGYNPVKPGRPSQIVHTYLMAELRLVMGAEVKAGNESASSPGTIYRNVWIGAQPRPSSLGSALLP